jgi:hypothetical protein
MRDGRAPSGAADTKVQEILLAKPDDILLDAAMDIARTRAAATMAQRQQLTGCDGATAAVHSVQTYKQHNKPYPNQHKKPYPNQHNKPYPNKQGKCC